MADNVMTFRYVVKEVALGEGVRASFMPKPFAEYPGSAMHTHMSLFEGETNAFHSPDDPLQLSDVGKSFIAGILEHASEISAVTNQWVNSYKRLVAGGERPPRRPGGGQSLGIGAGADVHAQQVVVASRRGSQPRFGLQPLPDLRGAAGRRAARVEKGYVLGPQAEDNVWTLTSRNGARWATGSCRGRSAMRSRPWRTPSWWPRRWGSTCSTSSCATSAPSGRPTAATSPPTSSSSTCRSVR
jgi:glutamine synthetase